jgi:uncharacterized protein YkwD
MVTALVAQVRDLWDEKKSYDIPDGFYEIAGEIRGINASIRQAAYGEPTEDPGTWLMHLPPKGLKLTVRTVATGPADRKQLDDSVEVMLANAASPAGATKGEVAQCLITNEYRIMMGRHAVRLYDRLVEASHGHCNDMNRLSFFSHTSPVPEKKTVGDRLRLAGMAAVGGSENIAISSGPERAHNGWIHSSGHHRNLLAAAWRLMGPGNVGRYWCQNFAVRDGNPPTSASADAK